MTNKWRIDSYINWPGVRYWRVWNPRGHLEYVGPNYVSARRYFIARDREVSPAGVTVELHEVTA